MKRIVAIFMTISLLACAGGPCSPDEEEEEVQAAVIDDCSDDHEMNWVVGAMGESIMFGNAEGELGPLDQSCNPIQWHVGDAFQGPAAFHIEPHIVIAGPAPEFFTANYTLELADGTEVGPIGTEVWPDSWTPIETDKIAYLTQIFIGTETRGKNVVLRATIQRDDGEFEEIRAAFHIAEADANN